MLYETKLRERKLFIKNFISDYTENRDIFDLINSKVNSFHNDRKK